MKTLVPVLLLAVTGCAAPPAVESEQTIEHFVSALSGKELRLQFPFTSLDASTGVSALSGAKDATFGYAGLKQVYAPAYQRCEAGGGALRIVEQRAFSKAGPRLPVRLQCRANDKLLWTLGARYEEKVIPAEKGHTILLTPQFNLSAGGDIADRRASRDAVLKPEQGVHDKEQAKPRVAAAEKQTAPQVQKTAQKTARNEELRLFRKNLKAGDHVQWKAAAMPGKGVGQVIRLDGDLALVQFDNHASAGQSLRYFKRSQLEPFDGIQPVRAAR